MCRNRLQFKCKLRISKEGEKVAFLAVSVKVPGIGRKLFRQLNHYQ